MECVLCLAQAKHLKKMVHFKLIIATLLISFPGGSDGKESTCLAGDLSSIPGLGLSPGGGHLQPTPVFVPGESHGQRSLVGYSPGSQRVWHCRDYAHTYFKLHVDHIMYSLVLHCLTASQVVLMVKNPPVNAGDISDVVWFPGWEDPLQEGMQPTPVFLPGESMDGGGWWATVQGHKESDTMEAT